MARFACKAN